MNTNERSYNMARHRVDQYECDRCGDWLDECDFAILDTRGCICDCCVCYEDVAAGASDDLHEEHVAWVA